jgi:KipI family sensor histidine kinase inhibitor
MIRNIINLGDAAAYCDFGPEVNQEINKNVIKYFRNIKDRNIRGITNITPSYNKLIISFDLSVTKFTEVKKLIENLEIEEKDENLKKMIEIPICCDEGFRVDHERLENLLKIKFEEILDIFFHKEYFCYMTGFIAGMPFLGDLNEQLRAKRLETPRVKVPKGSIGLTEQFCNIYTYESPGGWNIIGRTPLDIFDKKNQDFPALINPGDKVKFKKISKDEYDRFKK